MITEQNELIKQGYDACMATLVQYRDFNDRTATLPLISDSYLAGEMQAVGQQSGPDGPWNPKLAEQLTGHAAVYVEGARQHLIAITAHLEQGRTGIFLGPSVRSIAEAAGRTIWLLGNDLTIGRDVRRRVARLLLDKEDDDRTYRKIADDLKIPEKASGHRTRATNSFNAISQPGIFRADEIEIETVETTRAGESIDKKQAVFLCGKERLPGPAKFVAIARKLTNRPPDPLYAYWCTLTHPNLTAPFCKA